MTEDDVMEMIPKALVLEIITVMTKLDKDVMEDIITKDKTEPLNADLMRITQDKTAKLVESIHDSIKKIKGKSMDNKDICNGCLELAEQQVTTAEKMVTASQIALRMGKLLEKLTNRVEKLEKQVELVGRRN